MSEIRYPAMIPELPTEVGETVEWFSGANTYRFTLRAPDFWGIQRSNDFDWEGALFALAPVYDLETTEVTAKGVSLTEVFIKFLN